MLCSHLHPDQCNGFCMRQGVVFGPVFNFFDSWMKMAAVFAPPPNPQSYLKFNAVIKNRMQKHADPTAISHRLRGESEFLSQ